MLSDWMPVRSFVPLGIVVMSVLAGCAPSSDLLNTSSLPAKATIDAAASPSCSGQNCRAVVPKQSEKEPIANAGADAVADLMIEFDSDDAPVSARDRKALAAALDLNAKAGRQQIVIHAARGGDGNIFERAILAERRARLVKQLLPSRMVKSVEFDPLQADDTVRIQFLPQS